MPRCRQLSRAISAEVIEYFNEHGELDKSVVVCIEDGKYKLQDKYLGLVVAKKLGHETVPAEMDRRRGSGRSPRTESFTLPWA